MALTSARTCLAGDATDAPLVPPASPRMRFALESVRESRRLNDEVGRVRAVEPLGRRAFTITHRAANLLSSLHPPQ
jgi:hypothetical protein